MATRNKMADLQAIRAWTQRHSGTWTEDDETNLQKWLDAAPENKAAYDMVRRAWSATGQMAGRVSRSTPIDLKKYGLWAAAAILLALAYPLWSLTNTWWNGTPANYTAQRGETRTLQLADGTRITLDADSEIEASIGARSRHMVLRRGEALLTVVHDATRPFKVDIGPGRITDFGTRFDIETLQGKTRISVLEGQVGVTTSRGTIKLDAGHASGYDGKGVLLPVSDIDGTVTIWETGQRHFNADRLSDVLERITRYHPVTFIFKDPELEDLRVSGTFRTDNLELFLRTLRAALPIETVWLDMQRVEISRRSNSSHPI